MYDIITLGSATVDVFAKTTSQLVKFISSQGEKDFIAYPSGSKIIVSDIDFLVGGGGTNTAVAFARMGLKTAFLGKIGLDEHSYKVLHLLETEKIDFIGSKEGQTGYSIVLDSIEQDRTILAFKGSNNNLRYDEIPTNKLQSKWLYASSMVGESFITLKKIFAHMHAQGTFIAFNPSSYQAKQGLAELKETLQMCELLVLNLEEAKLLLRKENTIHELALELQNQGPNIVIITNGAKGATCYTQEKFYDIQPTPHLKVVETTGAGDAFASGFVIGLCYQLSVENALRLALIQSESVIRSYGAKNNLLDKETAFKELKETRGRVQIESLEKHKTHKNHTLAFGLDAPWLLETKPEQAFELCTGKKILGVEELGYALKYMTLNTFNHHVGLTKNDFAKWLREVFSLDELAHYLEHSASKEVMVQLIIGFIKKEHARSIQKNK